MLKKFGNSSRSRETEDRSSPSCELLADVSQRNLLSPPVNLFDHPHITSLDLRHNRLGLGCDPSAPKGWKDLPSFTRLTRLNLSNNQLRNLPPEIGQLTSLIVLNVVGNKLKCFPPEIGNMIRLQRLHADFNVIESLPKELTSLEYLTHLSFGYNKLSVIPSILSEMDSLQSLVMKGNALGVLDTHLLTKFKDLRSLDVRACALTGDAQLKDMRVLEVLNIGGNGISSLLVKGNTRLHTLDCSWCSLEALTLDGESLKIVIASHNLLNNITFLGIPTMLETLNISHNNFSTLPLDVQQSRNLFTVNASHNRLQELPQSVFQHSSLVTINLSFNAIKSLPDVGTVSSTRKLYLQHNAIEQLQGNFFSVMQKLEILNLSFNKLTKLPILERSLVCESMKELNMSTNELQSDVCPAITSTFPKLERLFLAYNHIENFQEGILDNLFMLKELSLAGNRLTRLPSKWSHLRQLASLRIHSNFLHKLPQLSECACLEALDVSNNRIQKLPLPPLSSPCLRWLDISGNPHLYVDPEEFKGLCTEKTVAFVDACCLGRRGPAFSRGNQDTEICCPWRIGLTEREGTKTRLTVDQNPMRNQLLLALTEVGPFGYSAILPPSILAHIMEKAQQENPYPEQYLSASTRAALDYLRSRGATLDTSLVLCQLLPVEGQLRLRVATQGKGRLMLISGKRIAFCTEEATKTSPSDVEWQTATQAGFFSDTSRPVLPAKYYPEVELDLRVHDLAIESNDYSLVLGSGVLWDNLPPLHLLRELTRRTTSPTLASKRLLEAVLPEAGDQDVSVCVVRLSSGPCESPFHRSPTEQRHACRTEDTESLQESLGFEDVETYKSWEYMLEQNHKLIFSRELETISRSALKNTPPRMNAMDLNSHLNHAYAGVGQYGSVPQYSPLLVHPNLNNLNGSVYSYKTKAF